MPFSIIRNDITKMEVDAIVHTTNVYLKQGSGTSRAIFLAAGEEELTAACEKLGAVALNHGDAGYQFDFFGPYRMQILVWEGDDEFPPSAQVLYSGNFAQGFAAEDRVVAGDILISAIKAAM